VIVMITIGIEHVFTNVIHTSICNSCYKYLFGIISQMYPFASTHLHRPLQNPYVIEMLLSSLIL